MRKHYMLPGSHEWPNTPQCRCGEEWDYWGDQCASNLPLAEVGLTEKNSAARRDEEKR